MGNFDDLVPKRSGNFSDLIPKRSGSFDDLMPAKPKDRIAETPKVFGVPSGERALSMAVGGIPAMVGGAQKAEDTLPLMGQIIGTPGGLPGSTAGATIGEVARQGVKTIRGKKFDPAKVATTAATTAATEGIFRGFGKALKPVSSRLMNFALRTPTKQLSKGQNLGEDALEQGLVGSSKKIIKKSEDLIEKSEKELERIISGSKGEVDVLKVASHLDDLKADYANVGDDASIKAIENIQEALLNKSPSGKISIQEAQKLKRSFYNVLRPSQYGTSEVPATVAARKASAYGLKKGIEKAEPNLPIRELNKKMGVAGNTRNAMEKASAIRKRQTPLPFFEAGGIGASLMFGHPGIASLILARRAAATPTALTYSAKALSDLAKKKTLGRGATLATSEGARRLFG